MVNAVWATNSLITIQVEKARPEAWIGEQVPLDQGKTLAQSFLESLSVHEPIYFLLGVEPGLEQSKFQVEDTSYIPELFYLLPKIDLNIRRIFAFGVQGGFEHESNGKSGDASRSTNYLYLKPILGVHLIDDFYLKIAPKIYTDINNSENTNDDLMDYMGYFDLEVDIVDPEGLALNSHLWWAKA
ncbi:MAG: phospholipase A [Desulfobacterales bacterium]|nr:phospholipase A [Desulfobacterales bacterium]